MVEEEGEWKLQDDEAKTHRGGSRRRRWKGGGRQESRRRWTEAEVEEAEEAETVAEEGRLQKTWTPR